MTTIRIRPLRGARETSVGWSGDGTGQRLSRLRAAQAPHSKESRAIASMTRWLSR
jgi:hypothetical protein